MAEGGEVEWRVGAEGSAFSATVCPPDDDKENMQVADCVKYVRAHGFPSPA